MDVDTRLLRYFAAVAVEGNLTRAAQRLFVSQPALTKQIKQLEARFGTALFVRSRAGMKLTEAGHVLAERVPDLVAGWDEAVRETGAAAARADRVLRVGFLGSAADEATRDIIAAFTRRRPDWRIQLRQSPWTDPTAGLAEGAVDAALLWSPPPGGIALRTRRLFTEPRWVALPAGHRLADRERIDFRDLWDEPFVDAPVETGPWRDYWLATGERQGHPVRIGATTTQDAEWLTAIASGYGIALAPRSAARFYSRPGVVYRPVTGVAPVEVVVAWPPGADADPAVRDFVHSCTERFPDAGIDVE